MYTETFLTGSSVLIAEKDALEHFRESSKLLNPLHAEQLAFAGLRATIASGGFYHCGDALYVLEGTRSVWHESCLAKSCLLRFVVYRSKSELEHIGVLAGKQRFAVCDKLDAVF